jgi:hypothetical protein
MLLAQNTVMGQQPEKSIDPEELRYNQNQFRSMEQ